MSEEKTLERLFDLVMAHHQELKTEYQTLHALALRNLTSNDRIERLLERLQDRMTAAEKDIVQLKAVLGQRVRPASRRSGRPAAARRKRRPRAAS